MVAVDRDASVELTTMRVVTNLDTNFVTNRTNLGTNFGTNLGTNLTVYMRCEP